MRRAIVASMAMLLLVGCAWKPADDGTDRDAIPVEDRQQYDRIRADVRTVFAHSVQDITRSNPGLTVYLETEEDAPSWFSSSCRQAVPENVVRFDDGVSLAGRVTDLRAVTERWKKRGWKVETDGRTFATYRADVKPQIRVNGGISSLPAGPSMDVEDPEGDGVSWSTSAETSCLDVDEDVQAKIEEDEWGSYDLS